VPRLLLLTPSELTRDPRARRAAVAASRRGWEVVGLCSQISGEPPAPLEGIPVVRVGRPASIDLAVETGLASKPAERQLLREARGLFRLGRLAARTAALWRAGRRLGRFDVVHANDLDTLPAARLLARRSRARLVYDAHELYAEFESRPPRLHRVAITTLESALARRADAVVTVNEPLRQELQARLRLPRAPFVVLNAPELDREEPPPTPRAGPLDVVYAGSFGPGRPIGDLLDALELAPNVRLTLRVVRLPASTLDRERAARGLGHRLAVADPLPPNEVIAALRWAQVGVIFDRPLTRNSELSLPNKFFEYLMAGLAVVTSRLPALGPLVEEKRVGLTFEPGRPAELAAALERLAADRELLATFRHRARQLAVECYNADRQAAALAEAWSGR
jgi:glycosyltransferase involved in cell wall biosynthesis